MGLGLQDWGCRIGAVGSGLGDWGCRTRDKGLGIRDWGCRIWAAGLGLWDLGCRSRAAGAGLQGRQHPPHHRQSTGPLPCPQDPSVCLLSLAR